MKLVSSLPGSQEVAHRLDCQQSYVKQTKALRETLPRRCSWLRSVWRLAATNDARVYQWRGRFVFTAVHGGGPHGSP
jgi:hypothetical protein